MAEGIYVRTLSVILVYKLVYYFLHVSVMDKQLRVFEVIMYILCSVLCSACVTLMLHCLHQQYVLNMSLFFVHIPVTLSD